MSFDLGQLRAAVDAHGAVARIVVVDHQGSVPRETGTSMLVWMQGQDGTIGGGALEYEAVAQARATTRTSLRKIPLGPSLGQCCGGAVTLVTEWFTATNLPEITHGLILRPLFKEVAQPLGVKRILRDARAGNPVGLTLIDDWLIEPQTNVNRPVWIYGAGHVGRAIAAILSGLPDCDVTLIDTAADRMPDTLPAGVTPLVAADPARVVRLAPDTAHHLILTYSHALDLELCHQVLGRPFAFAGLIGSATKWARFRKRLGSLGHSPAMTDRITCPIGDPQLGKHPQAIAIGVAAAMISGHTSIDQTTRSISL